MNIVEQIYQSPPLKITQLRPCILKGQVTFLKLCLLVVCLALIIPRFTLFLINNRFQAEKRIYMPVPA